MFNNSMIDFAWDSFFPTGSQWRLLKFNIRFPQGWKEYEADARKYWGADSPDQQRFTRYFGEQNTEETFFKKTQMQYAEYVDHVRKWEGLCYVNESVQVITLEPHVIALSKDWKGTISEHSDLEIWLKEERTWHRRHIRYCCEGYKFGTIYVPHDGIEAKIGERPGQSRVAHKWGPDRTITFDKDRNEISLGDAIFFVEA
jgi:hypothetical protein